MNEPTQRHTYEWLMIWGLLDRRYELTLLRCEHLRQIFYAYNRRHRQRDRLVNLAAALWHCHSDRCRDEFHKLLWRFTLDEMLDRPRAPDWIRARIPDIDVAARLLEKYEYGEPPVAEGREDGWAFTFLERRQCNA